MTWHGYFGIENLGLTEGQRQTLVTALRQLGPASHPQPCCLCHWRTRLDENAAIFEALFDEVTLTIEAWKNRLGAIFGVPPDGIGHDITDRSFAGGTTTAVTFSRSGDRLRVALFGGTDAEWNDSGNEARGYLKLYSGEWE